MAARRRTSGEDRKVGDAGPPTARTQKFLQSWSDPLAGTRAYSANLALADLDGSGNDKLLAATDGKRLRVYSGSDMASEHFLLEEPVAMVAYHSDTRTPPIPSVAVAGGSYVFIYRNMRPYFKFTLPAGTVDDGEKKVWEELKADRIDAGEAINQLREVMDAGAEVTYRSAQLMALEDNPAQAADFAKDNARKELKAQSVITCMTVLPKDSEDPNAVGCLVIGTESREVFVLNPTGSSILRRTKVPAVPVKLLATGMLDVDYRIMVATRDACIYTLRNIDSVSATNMQVSGMRITLESQVVGMVSVSRQVIVGCMDQDIHCFHIKGKKLWSMHMPALILTMEPVMISAASVVRAFVVGLANGEVRIYNDKKLIMQDESGNPNDRAVGMIFGRYSREDRCLLTSYASGGLTVRIIPRKTDFAITGGGGPPPEQDVKLAVPKKTKLYVEQTQREREHAVEMHRLFQRQLCKLRLDTARAYVRMITGGRGPSTYIAGTSVRITVAVAGLGPAFTLKISLVNSGSRAITGLGITYVFNKSLYSMPEPFTAVPLLLPSLTYKVEVPLICVDPEGGAMPVEVVMLRPDTVVPVLTAHVELPFCAAEGADGP